MKSRQQLYSYNDPYASMRKLIRRLEASNSILSGRDLWHHLEFHESDAHAWTIGNDIHFAAKKLPKPDDRAGIIAVTGISNHELGHVLYTPMDDDLSITDAGRQMLDKLRADRVYHNLWNILEDQRMEGLLFKRYNNQRPYLVAAFRHIVMPDVKYHDTAYLLARGRRYLPVKIRRMFMRKFKKPELIPDVRRIIDAFCKLNLFRRDDLIKADALVTELQKLMADNGLVPPPEDECGCDTLTMSVGSVHGMFGKPSSDSKPSAEQTKQKADEVDGLLAGVAQDIDAENNGDKPADSDAKTLNVPGGSPGGSKGKDAEDKPSEDDDIPAYLMSATAAVQGALQDALADKSIDLDVLAAEKFMRDAMDINASRVSRSEPIAVPMPLLAKKVGEHLRKLEDEVDPHWLQGVNTGKLNVGRAIARPDDKESVFDQWIDGGMGGIDQEWVVLLDCSSSMSAHFGNLSKVAWIMKRAAEQIEARMTVIAWGTVGNEQLVYGPNDKTSSGQYPLMASLGGTDPFKALFESYKLLAQTKRSQKGLLIMTDGEWNYRFAPLGPWKHPEQIIEEMNASGVDTHLVKFGSDAGSDNHKCSGSSRIHELGDMAVIMKSLIAERIKVTRR